MSLQQFLNYLIQISVVLISIITLIDFFRHRDQSRLDIFLLFFDLAIIVSFQWLSQILGKTPPAVQIVENILLVAHPYLLLRLVNHLQPVPRSVRLIGIAGLALSWLPILLLAPLPPSVGVLIALYMVFIEGYSTLMLLRGALTTRGVSHARLLLAASGSLFLTGFFVIAGVSAASPTLSVVLSPLSQFMAISSMLSYYFGFAPPNWLRRSWQLAELYRFIESGPAQWVDEPDEEKLKRLAIAAERAVGGEVAGVALWDREEKQLDLIASSRQEKASHLPPLQSPSILQAWEQKKPALIRLPEAEQPEASNVGNNGSPGSILISPIVSRENAWGLLLIRLVRVPLFASEDLGLLSMFNHQAAISLDFSALLSEQKALLDQQRTYNKRLEAMKEIDRSILAARSTKQIASKAVKRLQELIPSQRASVAIFDLEKNLGKLVATNSVDEIGPSEGSALPMDEFPSFEATTQGRTVTYIQDVLDERDLPPIIEKLRDQGIRSLIYTPLVAEDHLIGAISMSSVQAQAFEPHHLEILREVADQLAIGFQQTRLKEELQQYASELEQRVAERTAELEKSVADLQEEVVARQQATEALRVAQDRLKQRAAELNQANKELEAFAYSVSHDLRAPLRAIDGFSRILISNHHQELSEESQRYLNMVRTNTQQMGQLIDDLLSFSRLNRQSMNVQAIDPNPIIRLVLRDLQKANENHSVEIIHQPLPNCRADPSLLRQVYTNLLSNAMKFSSKKDKPCIQIGCRQQDGEEVYFVCDNGVGFDMRYAEKMFGVFQRLHRAEDFEGTGVGLAIVQRIIQRHGGRVWAEGEIDKGASFFFTLPG